MIGFFHAHWLKLRPKSARLNPKAEHGAQCGTLGCGRCVIGRAGIEILKQIGGNLRASKPLQPIGQTSGSASSMRAR